ncbi:hypothetical protein [Desulfomicrobium escambiense]|uniref:hypothetical protein n=1 Tax=Desulfomicrobium escambiense TaxID=29503 RepID=UPI00040349FD|nr:hypothetical protein [Desulfomicrobium escambiense]
MVDNLNLTTLISQIPEAQKIHHTQVAHPEAQQALAQEAVLRRQRQEQKQVLKSEATDSGNLVDPEGHSQSSGQFFAGHGEAQDTQPEPESDQGRLIDTQV